MKPEDAFIIGIFIGFVITMLGFTLIIASCSY